MDPARNGSPRAGDEDPLEQLLKAAAWPRPEPDRLARLHQRWREWSPARVRRHRLVWTAAAVAVAAGLLIAVTLRRLVVEGSADSRPRAPAAPGKQIRQRAQRDLAKEPAGRKAPPALGPGLPTSPQPARRQETLAQREGREKGELRGQMKPTPHPSPPSTPLAAASRPATLYERLALRRLTRRRRPSVGQADEKLKETDRKLLEEAITRRLADPDGDLDELAGPLSARRQSLERMLSDRIRRSRGPEQVAAVELLGRVGAERSIGLLLELGRSPTTHAAAVRALAHLADSEALGQLAAEEADPDLQRELLAALLSRGDARSVALYLTFVPRRDTHDVALAALDHVGRAPVERLFELLESPKRTQRTTAALVLASLDDPEVSARLIQMVVHEGNRQEALLALVASSQRDAFRFVTLARRDPLLLGSVRTVEHRLRTLVSGELSAISYQQSGVAPLKAAG